MTSLDKLPVFGTASEELRRDPYGYYRTMRGRHRVYRTEFGFPVLHRYQDVKLALTDGRFARSPESFQCGACTPNHPNQTTLFQMKDKWLIFRDRPDHTRLRGIVKQRFSRSAVTSSLGKDLGTRVELLLDDFERTGGMDLISDFAQPLIGSAIVNLLGLPGQDQSHLTRLAFNLMPTFDPNPDFKIIVQGESAADALNDFFTTQLNSNKRSEEDDLLSVLVHAHREDSILDEQELLAMCSLLLVTGHTTVNLIGNGVLALLEHPRQLDELRMNPALINSTIEELLRYDSPTQVTNRTLVSDLEIDDVTLPRGQEILLLLGAANRDPVRFSAPEELNIRRGQNRHLSFGLGLHTCLGAALARIEAVAAISRLVGRFSNFALAGAPVWLDSVTQRGLQRLDLSV